MKSREPWAPKTALIACALFCDSTLEMVDGKARKFCLVSWCDREELPQYASNLAGVDRLEVEMLTTAAERLLAVHRGEQRGGGG